MSSKAAGENTKQEEEVAREIELALNEVEALSDSSSSDEMAVEQVEQGDWLRLKTPEKTRKQRSESFEKEKSLEDRMNAALDASIDDERRVKRQNPTLEDYFASPGRKSRAQKHPRSKRNPTSPIVSPPHKSHRIFSPHKQQESRSTTRFIREVCQKLNEPKHNLMARVLEQTGKIFILDLMAQVEAVEDKGGQFVADGTRRRTRGGVFLNLLKAQVTKEQWDKIFEEEKEAQKRRKAMKRRLRYNGEAAREGEKTPTQASPLPLSYKCVLQS